MAAPAICRWIVGFAGRIVTPHERVAWREDRLNALEGLWTLIERGEITPYPAAELAGFCISALREALVTRFTGVGLREWALMPSFVFALGAAALVVGAIFSRAYAFTRTVAHSAHYLHERDTFVAYTVP